MAAIMQEAPFRAHFFRLLGYISNTVPKKKKKKQKQNNIYVYIIFWTKM